MWLHVRSGPGAGDAVQLPADRPVVLGRQAGCDLVVRDPLASRRHVELVPLGDGRWRASDLGSANGTSVDGMPLHTAVLEGGEDLLIGTTEIAFSRAAPDGTVEEPAAADAPELATRSMVMRLVSSSTRRTRRVAIGAGGLLLVAVVALAVVLLTREDADERLPAVLAQVQDVLEPLTTLRADGAQSGTGTGWYPPGGGLVTAAHVVNQGPTVRTAAGDAGIAGVAPCQDLALLEAPGTSGGGGSRAARIAEDAARAGQTVIATGFQGAGGGSPVATRGVVSAVGVDVDEPAPDVPAYRGVLQTDSALNPGLSGGPLVDLDGEVVGVDVATRTEGDDGRTLQNVNYAVPIAAALPVLAQLRAGRSPSWTGFTFAYPTDSELQEAGLDPGLRITGAVQGTPAARSGLAAGTLIAGVDGRRIGSTLASLCERLDGKATGDVVTLNIAVPGRARTRQVRLELA